MKYIRTKDGQVLKVLEIVQNKYIKEGYYYKVDIFQKRDVGVYPKDVIAQADTIEELCDGIFVEDKNNPNVWFLMELDEFVKEKKENNHLKEWNYLGFIKTDKGLIYVAKMNDKGELELL